MSRKYKALYIVIEENEDKYEYRLAWVLQVLRSGPDGRHGEEFWWKLMKETIKAAYRLRDKKLYLEAKQIFDSKVWNS